MRIANIFLGILGIVVLVLAPSITSLAADSASSIAIIGGADGPTSVFIAGRIGNGIKVVGAVLACLVIGLIGFCVWKFSGKDD